MFDGLMKSKFYNKCKSNIKLTKTRLEAIRKKRNAMQKYLTNDIVDLLRNGLDINAYGRAEGLLVEQNLTSCYESVDMYCTCIYNHVSAMQKQRECPEECKEAVPSLIYATARFSDLPELRDLRSLFTERYGNSLESCISKEFVDRLKSNPPSKEMKIQLLRFIAQESSIKWNRKALEQKLCTPTPPEQDHPKNGSFSNTDNDKCQKTKDVSVPKRDNQDVGNRLSNRREHIASKRNDRDLTSHGRKDATDNGFRMPKSSEDEMSTNGSVSENEVDDKRPFYNRFVPPPYLKSKAEKNGSNSEEPTKLNDEHIAGPVDEDKPKPRSVRKNSLKLQPGRDHVGSSETKGVMKMNSIGKKQEDARRGLRTMFSDDIDPRDEEDRKLDELLTRYSKKQSPYGAHLRLPPKQRDRDNGESTRHQKYDLDLQPPARVTSLPQEPTKRYVRTASLQPEILGKAGHVHPNLPDYDELVDRVAALKGR